MPPDLTRLADNLELDRRAYELRRSGKPVKLSRIPMELLLLLVERRGELVSRDEIGERIWGKDVFVDQDNNINAAIRRVPHPFAFFAKGWERCCRNNRFRRLMTL